MAPLGQTREQNVLLAAPAVAAVVLALTALRLGLAGGSGLSLDEAYYTLWSQHLSAGYFDHPPVVAALIALGRSLLGDNPLGVRVMAVACGLLASLALWRTGALLFDRAVAGLAVLLFNLMPLAGLGFIITPDQPSVLFWLATLWAIAEFQQSGKAAWWLVAGLCAGLGLASKYTDAFLGPGLLLWLLTARERRQWFKLWQVWAGAALALIVFGPVIWWNAQHQWASFAFQSRRTNVAGAGTDALATFGDFLVGQLGALGPVLFVAAIVGGVLFLRRPGESGRGGLALPVWTSLPAFVYFVLLAVRAPVEANWPAPLAPSFALIAAWALLALIRRRSVLGRSLVALQFVVGIGLTALVYTQLLVQPFSVPGGDRTNETRGWGVLQHAAAALARANGAHWIATTQDYGVTAELSAAALSARDPLPVRQVDEPLRWTYLPPITADAPGWPALFLAPDTDVPATPPAGLFGTVQPLGTLYRPLGRDGVQKWSAYLVGAPTPAFFAGLAE